MQLIVCTAVALSCFFVYSFVYLFNYYSLNIFSLCVFVCIIICSFITTLISNYFPARPSHSPRLILLFLSGCALFLWQLFTFYDSTLLYQEHNRDCCVLLYVTRVRRISVMAREVSMNTLWMLSSLFHTSNLPFGLIPFARCLNLKKKKKTWFQAT